MKFKESVNVYLEACKCGPAGGKCSNGRAASVCVAGGKCSNGKEATIYTPGTKIKAIKLFDAIKQLVELGIPKDTATEAVRKAIADRSKIESITNRICCECADEIATVIDEEEFSDEKSRLNKAKEHLTTMKGAAYNNYLYNKERNAELKSNAKNDLKVEKKRGALNKKVEKYENKALRYAQGDKAVRSDKIRKTIAGILMAAAIGGGGTAIGTKVAYDNSMNNRNEHDAYEKEYNENSVKSNEAKQRYDEKSKKFILDFEGRKGINKDKKDFKEYGKKADENKRQMADVDERERNSFGYKIPGIKQIKGKVYNESGNSVGTKSIKEEIMDNTSVACFANICSESVITESIKSGSVSKGLRKQLAKLEAESKKANGESRKEIDKAISVYKKAADDFEKVELKYSAGDPKAKSEYKDLKSKYSPQVRKLNFQAMAKGGAITAAVAAGVAGAAVLFCRYDPSDAEKIKDSISNGMTNVFKEIKSIFPSNSERLLRNMENDVKKARNSLENGKMFKEDILSLDHVLNG